MSKLMISEKLSLPVDAVTQKMAWLGRTGSGKTYGATKLAELMIEAMAQVVAIDPVGVWWGLRLAANGKDPGVSIPVFGGLHGDIPLEVESGKYIADLVVDNCLSVILDVSQFEHDTQKAKFAGDFAERFFFRKKASPSAVHLFLEECQEFVPQNPQKGEERMLHNFTRIWKLGRNFGIGGSLISQRPQEINKKALNLTELMLAFQMTGPHERKTIRQWMDEKGLDDSVEQTLPKLQVGTAHIWSPSWLAISAEHKIAAKKTFNASATPEVGKAAVKRDLAPVDIDRIREEMKATIERAKEEDPRELKRRIADLQRQLTTKQQPVKPEVNEAEIERRVQAAVHEYAQKAEALTRKLSGDVQRLTDGLAEIQRGVNGTCELLRSETAAGITEFRPFEPGGSLHVARPATPPVPQVRRAPLCEEKLRDTQKSTYSPRSSPSIDLPTGERAVLVAAAQYHPNGVERDQLSVLTGYKRSSRDAYIQRLREKGLVDVTGARIVCTKAGWDALPREFEPLPTGRALQEYWRQRLPEGERKVLEVLIDAQGESINRDGIDEITGYKRSSRDAYIQRLAARRLVETVGRGEVKAAEVLFA
jgi:hypothetical protein